MSMEENKAIVRRHVEEWSNKNPVAAIDELVATDIVSHESGKDVIGIDPFRQYYVYQAKTYPDRNYSILDTMAEGDKVAIWLRYNYTNPATGQRWTSTGVNVYRIKQGKIQEYWYTWQAEEPA